MGWYIKIKGKAIKNIAGVIVTYNRKELLAKNLKSLKNQKRHLDKVYIVDNNSSDNTKEYLIENGLLEEYIEYCYLPENIGGAGGFYTGMKHAYEDGFEWIYLMDDDGRPYNNETISNMLTKIENMGISSKDKYIVNSLVICDENTLTFRNKHYKTIESILTIANNGIIENKTQLFNGSLFSRGLVKEIGYPNKDFFIKGDEVDYRRRSVKANAKLFTVIDSLYYHPEAPETRLKLFGLKEYYICIESPWKEYYTVRNSTYSILHNEPTILGRIKALLFYWKRVISVNKINAENKIEILKMMKKGYSDGRFSRLGPTVRP